MENKSQITLYKEHFSKAHWNIICLKCNVSTKNDEVIIRFDNSDVIAYENIPLF